MKYGAFYTFCLLSIAFLMYSFSIYLRTENNHTNTEEISMASEGKLVWQKYNCQSCHQLYGLGGYLGTDLTNIYSQRLGNELLIEAMIKSGNKWMPSYQLEKDEMQKLIAFLKAMDATGKADPRIFKAEINGMIYR